MVGFEDRGIKVGDGRTRRRDHQGWRTRFDGQTQRKEGGNPLIDAHVQTQAAGLLELGRSEGEGL
jgi:hypothetical protein